MNRQYIAFVLIIGIILLRCIRVISNVGMLESHHIYVLRYVCIGDDRDRAAVVVLLDPTEMENNPI